MDRIFLLLIFFLLGCAVFVVFSKWELSIRDRVYIVLIASISLSLLLSSTLVSPNLLGWDIHDEYRLFLGVATTGTWDPTIADPYNSCLSVTILPAILSAVTGLDGLIIFKVVFPILFSIVPIVLYKISRKIFPPEGAFLSAFLFMSYAGFYLDLISLGREEIAEVFVGLLILLSFSDKLPEGGSSTIAVLLLSIGLVTAHYSTALIFIPLLYFSFLVSRISSKFVSLQTLSMVFVTTIIAVAWQTYVASSFVTVNVVKSISTLLSHIVNDFFNVSTRPSIVSEAVVGGGGLVTEANRIVQWLVQLFLVSALIIRLVQKESSVAERRMLVLITFGLALIGSAVVFPHLGGTIDFTRFYQLGLFLVAPAFVIGVDVLDQGLRKVKLLIGKGPKIRAVSPRIHGRYLATTILFLYFLFVSGWISAVSNQKPFSFILDRERMATYPNSSLKDYYYSYVTQTQDIAAARWLRSLASEQQLCADLYARDYVLTSYGQFLRTGGGWLPTYCNFKNSIIYLDTENNVAGIGNAYGQNGIYLWPVSSISTELSPKNRIYSNSGATVYG